MGIKFLSKLCDDNSSSVGESINLAPTTAESAPTTVIIDGCAMTYHIYESEQIDWMQGGEYLAFYLAVERYIKQFVDKRVQVEVGFDGMKDSIKGDTHKKRQNKYMDTLKVTIENIFSKKKFISDFFMPNGIMGTAAFACKAAGARVWKATKEADMILMRRALETRAIAVISNDSDIAVMDGPGLVLFGSIQMASPFLSAQRFSSVNLGKFLGIQTHLFPAFAAICPNDYITAQQLRSIAPSICQNLFGAAEGSIQHFHTVTRFIRSIPQQPITVESVIDHFVPGSGESSVETKLKLKAICDQYLINQVDEKFPSHIPPEIVEMYHNYTIDNAGLTLAIKGEHDNAALVMSPDSKDLPNVITPLREALISLFLHIQLPESITQLKLAFQGSPFKYERVCIPKATEVATETWADLIHRPDRVELLQNYLKMDLSHVRSQDFVAVAALTHIGRTAAFKHEWELVALTCLVSRYFLPNNKEVFWEFTVVPADECNMRSLRLCTLFLNVLNMINVINGVLGHPVEQCLLTMISGRLLNNIMHRAKAHKGSLKSMCYGNEAWVMQTERLMQLTRMNAGAAAVSASPERQKKKKKKTQNKEIA